MTGTAPEATIVVGTDGSPGARAALDWAVAEAKLRGMRILLVSSLDLAVGAAYPYAASAIELMQESAQQLLQAELDHARAAGVPAQARFTTGSPSQALMEAAKDASMLVVGSRGHGGFAGLLLGSVSSAVVHHARVPVVVVPRNGARAAGLAGEQPATAVSRG